MNENPQISQINKIFIRVNPRNPRPIF
jgi:hypothetical protein